MDWQEIKICPKCGTPLVRINLTTQGEYLLACPGCGWSAATQTETTGVN